MKKIMSVALLLFSAKALAIEPLAKVTGDDISITSIHECMMMGWVAAEPTDEQAASGKTMMDDLHTFIADRIENITSLKRNVMAAWIRHPIDLFEVNSAKGELENAVVPVRDEITTATVNVINLLNVFQRGKFDKAFVTCMHK
jgi:hypothetical protein